MGSDNGDKTAEGGVVAIGSGDYIDGPKAEMLYDAACESASLRAQLEEAMRLLEACSRSEFHLRTVEVPTLRQQLEEAQRENLNLRIECDPPECSLQIGADGYVPTSARDGMAAWKREADNLGQQLSDAEDEAEEARKACEEMRQLLSKNDERIDLIVAKHSGAELTREQETRLGVLQHEIGRFFPRVDESQAVAVLRQQLAEHRWTCLTCGEEFPRDEALTECPACCGWVAVKERLLEKQLAERDAELSVLRVADTLPDPMELMADMDEERGHYRIRAHEAEGKLAERDAEIGRLREALGEAAWVITQYHILENFQSPDLFRREDRLLADIAAMKGGE